jgi:hypothetical protein
MAIATLEDRVAALEKSVAELLNSREPGRPKDWRRTRGAFTGDEFMKQVFAEGRKIRSADRKDSVRRHKKGPTST